MVLFRKNKNWKAIHISLNLKLADDMATQVEEAVKKHMEETHLKRQWKTIDIVDVQIFSSTYNPTKETTFLDMMVFVVDLTGEQL